MVGVVEEVSEAHRLTYYLTPKKHSPVQLHLYLFAASNVVYVKRWTTVFFLSSSLRGALVLSGTYYTMSLPKTLPEQGCYVSGF